MQADKTNRTSRIRIIFHHLINWNFTVSMQPDAGAGLDIARMLPNLNPAVVTRFWALARADVNRFVIEQVCDCCNWVETWVP